MITCGTQIVSGAPVYGGGGGVPTSRTITAGTGLTGGGDLSADRTLAVSFGTTSGTVAAGNDSRLSDARTPTAHASSHGSAGSDPITIASTQVTGLGGAALLNVGTSAGTVAAGDDSRIVGAVPSSRTIAGLALSSDISASALNTALGSNASLGVRTAIADTGWTDATTGTASITRAAGVHTLSVNANASAREYRATISTAECPAIEVMGRFQLTTGNPATAWATSIWLSNVAETYGFVCQVHETGKVGLYKGDGSMTLVSLSAGTVSLTSLAWLRLVVTPSYAAAYYGSSGSSTPPTTWLLASSVATTLATLADAYLTQVSIRTQRTNTGSGTYTTEWQNLQWRILGVSP